MTNGSAFFRDHHAHDMVHIGQLIEAELHRQERSVIWLARKLYCDRTNVYSIFKRQSIDTDLLMRICHILGYDFFSCYSDDFRQSFSSEIGRNVPLSDTDEDACDVEKKTTLLWK